MKYKNYDLLYSAIAKLKLDIHRFSIVGLDLECWQVDDLEQIICSMRDKSLTREDFCNILQAIKDVDEHFRETEKNLEDICEDTQIYFKTYSDDIIAALGDEMNDTNDVLSYYYYDTNCSKDYDASIEQENGQRMVFRTFEDVYNYLKETMPPTTGSVTHKDLTNILKKEKNS